MQVTFDLPNKLVQQIQILPNRDSFVCEVLEKAMGQEEITHVSKWANIARRIKENPLELGDYTEKFKQDMREVREGFVLKGKRKYK